MKKFRNPLIGVQLEQGKKSDAEIARAWDINPNQMGKIREYFGLPSRRVLQKERNSKIISHNTKVIQERKDFFKQKHGQMVNMWNNGLDVLEIGKELSMGVPSVYQRLIRMKRQGVDVKYRRSAWSYNRILPKSEEKI